ncbi:hypothetical protein ACFOOM_22975 [Streptomyces echinoruber]|uniref:Uncharacterized protein n=1 Tax=Streptomyces echinoruber TaxID=68898 RepID=A0A918R3G7_9ACTN|nr:hypothetical protein [Streptomyces echinoruber]GGZ83077.1 hypothetical protein GCM10010389_21410 [Streptomyces echinoruber]
MHGNAEDDERPLEERDRYDGGPDADPDAGDTGEHTAPEPHAGEPESHGAEGADTTHAAAVVPGGGTAAGRVPADASPDVFLDVPVLKVDEIDLDVEDLRAHVSLRAEVLDLLKLNVGADVTLGRVHLGIAGVEAQAQLRVRLDNVALIINRVLTTLDRNPEILHELARGVGSAAQDVGGGARQAVGGLGAGAGRAVQDVGRGAGTAVREVGRGAGSAAREVGRGAGRVVQDVGSGAGQAVEDVGGEAGRAVGKAGEEAGSTAGSVVGKAAGATETAGETARTSGRAVADVPDTPDTAGGTPHRTEPSGRSAARRPAAGERGRTVRSQSGTRTRRVRAGSEKPPPRPTRRRTAEEREEPP